MSKEDRSANAPIRVVVVDDQPLERAGIALILDSDDNIAVIGEAASGEAAISLVADRRPDVVLMDIRMPGMGGIEATKILAERYPDVKVLVLTTFDLDEYAFGSLRAGASAFLLKGTKPAALVDAVKTVASGASVVDPRLTAKLIDHFLTTQMPMKRPDEPDPRLSQLSPRETEVLAAISRGLTNAEISSELHLAETTVKSHINSLFAKLHLRDRVHAVILGREIWDARSRS